MTGERAARRALYVCIPHPRALYAATATAAAAAGQLVESPAADSPTRLLEAWESI